MHQSQSKWKTLRREKRKIINFLKCVFIQVYFEEVQTEDPYMAVINDQFLYLKLLSEKKWHTETSL